MQPILRNFPDFLETERLLIRAPRHGDGNALYAAVVESLDALRAWPASLPWALQEPSPEASEIYCRMSHAAFLARTDLPMLVFMKEQNTLVGASGLHRSDWAVPRFEVGYWGRQSFHGQGLITEAVRGITRFAFAHLGARRVEGFTDEANISSRRVVERCGYALEGILRNERIDPDGTLRNTCVYAITT